jgi:hypothetical protein
MRCLVLQVCVITTFLLCCQTTAGSAEERFALLIGNQTYKDSVGPLVNPHNDVAVVGQSLKQLGFQVTTIKDAGFFELIKSISRHVSQLKETGAQAVSFVYYIWP